MRSRIGLRVLAAAAVIAAVAGPGMATMGGAQGAETCFGLTATIVAMPGADRVEGTEGGDVIVAENVSTVWALGGDDAVCVEGVASIDAGDGNDRVRSASDTGRNLVVLGSGSDLFEGSAGRDRVYAEGFDGEDPYPGSGSENTDVVHTHGGSDQVTGGAYGQANDDRVELGGGDDTMTVRTSLGGDAQVSGGPGTDGYFLRMSSSGRSSLGRPSGRHGDG